MSFKKIVFALLVFVPGMALAGGTDNTGQISLGYSGMFTGSFLQGISLRSWASKKAGFEGNMFYAHLGVDNGEEENDASLYAFTVKGLYAPVVRENSRFYFGLEGGYGRGEVDDEDDGLNLLLISPLIGAEYHLSGLPEIGFNWEVGYKWTRASVDGTDGSLDISAVGTTIGAHYYF